MNKSISLLQKFKPGISKRYLLFVAAVVWTFAGGMLLFRGFSMLALSPDFLWIKVPGGIIGGFIFYLLLFSRISLKHTQRILKMEIERPCFFSFFNFRSYLLMVLMISGGIVLRKSGIVPMEYLSVFYVSMGTPLFLSAFRFYYNGINYKKTLKLLNKNINTKNQTL